MDETVQKTRPEQIKESRFRVKLIEIRLDSATKRKDILEGKIRMKPEGEKIIAATYETYKLLRRHEDRAYREIIMGRAIESNFTVDPLFDADLLMTLTKTAPSPLKSKAYSGAAINIIAQRIAYQTEKSPVYLEMQFPEVLRKQIAEGIKSRIEKRR
jgi:hypothetical protein